MFRQCAFREGFSFLQKLFQYYRELEIRQPKNQLNCVFLKLQPLCCYLAHIYASKSWKTEEEEEKDLSHMYCKYSKVKLFSSHILACEEAGPDMIHVTETRRVQVLLRDSTVAAWCCWSLNSEPSVQQPRALTFEELLNKLCLTVWLSAYMFLYSLSDVQIKPLKFIWFCLC